MKVVCKWISRQANQGVYEKANHLCKACLPSRQLGSSWGTNPWQIFLFFDPLIGAFNRLWAMCKHHNFIDLFGIRFVKRRRPIHLKKIMIWPTFCDNYWEYSA